MADLAAGRRPGRPGDRPRGRVGDRLLVAGNREYRPDLLERAFGHVSRLPRVLGPRSRAVQAVAPSLLDALVVVPPAGEYVADGAARQAAWVLSGDPEPPDWSATVAPQPVHAAPTPHVREAYAAARDRAD